MNKKKLAAFCKGEIERGFRLGVPGSGKTHGIFNTLIPAYLKQNPSARIAILSFTNKAVQVIAEYAQQFGFGDRVRCLTIHKFCKLVPDLNSDATKHRDLHGTRRTGDADEVDLIVVDEIGQVDDVLESGLNDAYLDGKWKQVIYCGDYEQVKPVNGEPAITPDAGDWVENLTVVKRSDAPDIAAFIQQFSAHIAAGSPGAKKLKLKASENIRPGAPADAVMTVAWRNKTVQAHNAALQGRVTPMPGDMVYCDTLKQELRVHEVIPVMNFDEFTWLMRRTNADGSPAFLDADEDQFRTLHRAYTLLRPRCVGTMLGLAVEDADGERFNIMTVFGSGDFRDTQKKLLQAGLDANDAVLDAYQLQYHKSDMKKKRKRVVDNNGQVYGNLKDFCDRKRGIWPNVDTSHAEIEARREAWGAYMIMEECVFHTDFTHARTVHAMQGSSVETVFVDVADMAGADNDTYHRLVYVGGSRARKTIYFG